MITFFVSLTSRRNPEYDLPQVILVPDGWNDWWKFQTLYNVVFIDHNNERHHIGGVKIGELNMPENQSRPDLQDIFEKLDDNFFSLGQDVDYYEFIKNQGDELRDNFFSSLNDIAFNPNIFEVASKERVTTISLMRSVSIRSVEGQFRRLAQGDATLTAYDFSYTSPKTRGIQSVTLDFNVFPKSNPPTNIHVIIGRNGVGKTHMMNNMIQSIIKQNENPIKFGKFSSSITETGTEIFANLVSVSFSAFDEAEIIPERQNKLEGLMYSHIGLRSESSKKEGVITTKSPTKLKREFARSAYKCKIGGKLNRLNSAIDALEADSIFSDADLKSLFNEHRQKEFEQDAADRFNRLSSGHKVVLLTITRLVETVEERSLVLIDEPESHLHPPLLSAFIRALSNLLVKRNAVAIITTHSPVVLQEVSKSCCWKLLRTGQNAKAERLDVESFGENVGSLTQEVFGLEVTESGFHKLLKSYVIDLENYDMVVDAFDNQLGQEAKAIIRALVFNIQNDQQ